MDIITLSIESMADLITTAADEIKAYGWLELQSPIPVDMMASAYPKRHLLTKWNLKGFSPEFIRLHSTSQKAFTDWMDSQARGAAIEMSMAPPVEYPAEEVPYKVIKTEEGWYATHWFSFEAAQLENSKNFLPSGIRQAVAKRLGIEPVGSYHAIFDRAVKYLDNKA